MSHEDPVVVEGGGGTAGVEDRWVSFQQTLEGLQVAWVSL